MNFVDQVLTSHFCHLVFPKAKRVRQPTWAYPLLQFYKRCENNFKNVTKTLQMAKTKKCEKIKLKKMSPEDTLVAKLHPKYPSKNLDFHPKFRHSSQKYFAVTRTPF